MADGTLKETDVEVVEVAATLAYTVLEILHLTVPGMNFRPTPVKVKTLFAESFLFIEPEIEISDGISDATFNQPCTV